MQLFYTQTCQKLPTVKQSLIEDTLIAPRNTEAYRKLCQRVEALYCLEEDWAKCKTSTHANEVKIASWNVERCINVKGSAALLAAHKPDIILLSEMDYGMARTGQRHTTQLLAEALSMGYTFGVEFMELGLGSGVELDFAEDTFNVQGWHGNAVLSRVKPSRSCLIRLDDHGHWFCENKGVDLNQPRLGGRVAILTVFPTIMGEVCTVSTHLESAGNIAHRQSQMERIMAAIDAFAPGCPAIIAGDLNTGNNLESQDWRDETLFSAAEKRGYSWACNIGGMTTRPSQLTRFPARRMKLDWFAHRGCKGRNSQIIPALDPDEIPLSDHELIMGIFEFV